MEATFANLERQGKTDIESLVSWMKDSKVIDQTREQEEKVRAFLSDVADKNKVQLNEFKEVMKKVAEEFKKNLNGVMKQLADCSPRLLECARDGASTAFNNIGGAIKDFMGIKKK